LVCFSNDLCNNIREKINNKTIVYYIKRPTNSIEPININKYINHINNDCSIIQLGQQYIKKPTIYTLKTKRNKVWLPGTEHYKQNGMNIFKTNLMISNRPLNSDVKILKLNNKDYNNKISQNITIIPVNNSYVNNSILEILSLNIPAFIYRIPACEEYLGKLYPCFYETIEDLENILNNKDKLIQTLKLGFQYLSRLNKQDLSISYFYGKLQQIIFTHGYINPNDLFLNNKQSKVQNKFFIKMSRLY
jgi:hypothetical protein